MPNILLVEDDDALSEGIALALRAQGTVRRCPTLAEAREALRLDRVWGDDFVEENALSVAVKRLRDKLEDDPARPVRLRTVYGIGYRWEAAP